MAHPGGRPLKFDSPEQILEIAEEYFRITPPRIQTITGVALALNTSRETLVNYEKRDEFFDTIKGIKDRVEHAYELTLRERGSAGDIFGLKNFGWKDRQETDITSKGEKINAGVNLDEAALNARLSALVEGRQTGSDTATGSGTETTSKD